MRYKQQNEDTDNFIRGYNSWVRNSIPVIRLISPEELNNYKEYNKKASEEYINFITNLKPPEDENEKFIEGWYLARAQYNNLLPEKQ